MDLAAITKDVTATLIVVAWKVAGAIALWLLGRWLISLALGLAAGVGRWDLAFVLAAFSLMVLSLLEWREPQQVFRSMEVKVTTRNVVATQQTLRSIFRKHGFDTELRTLDRDVTEESPGSLVFAVEISPTVSPDEMSEDILRLDGANVEGIEWVEKKSNSYMYQ
jgi:uncharacterized membrane protein YhiD involved in acid resistance